MTAGGLKALLAMAPLAGFANAADAACPLQLSVYGDAENSAEIDFMPAGTAATVVNRFRLLVDGDIVLDGIVQWSEVVKRPYGMLGYKCPEGDVTGPELEACTAWQGVIYTADGKGGIDLLPAETGVAPTKLILSDLGPSLRASAVLAQAGFAGTLSDIFALKGCQE